MFVGEMEEMDEEMDELMDFTITQESIQHTKHMCKVCKCKCNGSHKCAPKVTCRRKKKRICTHCGKQFAHNATHKRHEKMCRNKREFVCMDCKKEYKVPIYFLRHISNCPMRKQFSKSMNNDTVNWENLRNSRSDFSSYASIMQKQSGLSRNTKLIRYHSKVSKKGKVVFKKYISDNHMCFKKPHFLNVVSAIMNASKTTRQENTSSKDLKKYIKKLHRKKNIVRPIAKCAANIRNTENNDCKIRDNIISNMYSNTLMSQSHTLVIGNKNVSNAPTSINSDVPKSLNSVTEYVSPDPSPVKLFTTDNTIPSEKMYDCPIKTNSNISSTDSKFIMQEQKHIMTAEILASNVKHFSHTPKCVNSDTPKDLSAGAENASSTPSSNVPFTIDNIISSKRTLNCPAKENTDISNLGLAPKAFTTDKIMSSKKVLKYPAKENTSIPSSGLVSKAFAIDDVISSKIFMNYPTKESTDISTLGLTPKAFTIDNVISSKRNLNYPANDNSHISRLGLAPKAFTIDNIISSKRILNYSAKGNTDISSLGLAPKAFTTDKIMSSKKVLKCPAKENTSIPSSCLVPKAFAIDDVISSKIFMNYPTKESTDISTLGLTPKAFTIDNVISSKRNLNYPAKDNSHISRLGLAPKAFTIDNIISSKRILNCADKVNTHVSSLGLAPKSFTNQRKSHLSTNKTEPLDQKQFSNTPGYMNLDFTKTVNPGAVDLSSAPSSIAQANFIPKKQPYLPIKENLPSFRKILPSDLKNTKSRASGKFTSGTQNPSSNPPPTGQVKKYRVIAPKITHNNEIPSVLSISPASGIFLLQIQPQLPTTQIAAPIRNCYSDTHKSTTVLRNRSSSTDCVSFTPPLKRPRNRSSRSGLPLKRPVLNRLVIFDNISENSRIYHCQFCEESFNYSDMFYHYVDHFIQKSVSEI